VLAVVPDVATGRGGDVRETTEVDAGTWTFDEFGGWSFEPDPDATDPIVATTVLKEGPERIVERRYESGFHELQVKGVRATYGVGAQDVVVVFFGDTSSLTLGLETKPFPEFPAEATGILLGDNDWHAAPTVDVIGQGRPLVGERIADITVTGAVESRAGFVAEWLGWSSEGSSGDEPDVGDVITAALRSTIPGFDQLVGCPECPWRQELGNVVIHLNDSHEWTRARIADWLDTLDLDLEFHLREERR
jgi:hypothetical protein